MRVRVKSVETVAALRSVGGYVRLAAMGYAIGAANLIPGVSGGTMALLFGIYEDLLNAIRDASDRRVLKAALQRNWREVTTLLPWQFLLSLGGGAVLAVVTLSHLMSWVFVAYPVQIEAFFLGLIAASILIVSRRVGRWGLTTLVGLLLGALGAWLLMHMAPAQTPETLWLLFLSATMALGAMVLPGISGAFVLIVFGQYQHALNAVIARDLLRIGLVGLGGIVGIVTFAKALSWLLKRQHDLTLSILAGMICGSLPSLWPWKETYNCVLGEIIQQTNIMPNAWTGEVTIALLLALAGFSAVLLLGRARQPR